MFLLDQRLESRRRLSRKIRRFHSFVAEPVVSVVVAAAVVAAVVVVADADADAVGAAGAVDVPDVGDLVYLILESAVKHLLNRPHINDSFIEK
ncbi:hypothetical protein QCA50_016003 [Cerrena zonata]|uniref:Uncharacterized protein n=1 Tax=Cerrena zonata TaxID=2478898 RepID=A0AAW0FW62_9APHY